ncbi:MAG: zf-HC2 domain-containing protein [Chloroflexi bacterium]|nr:zf-HC2 domain-containing protein [Chloroflexota bacterium]
MVKETRSPYHARETEMTQDPASTPHPSPRALACRELLERASEYLESESALSQEEKEHIQRHLEECLGCKGFVSTLKDTISLLQTLPPSALPPELKQRLLQIYKGQPSS